MKVYVQRVGQGHRETVDEYPVNTREERKEAQRMLAEYQLSDPAGRYYLSRRPCKAWTENA